ncbi:MAG: hypothetical protein P1U44_10715 [Vicingaceae bacterium]|nr:hypothetical protein [Vicingaceae bacterium]
MIAVHQDKISPIQKEFLSEFENQRKKALGKLKKLSTSRLVINTTERNYLNDVIDLFDKKNILLSTPDEIEDLIQTIGSVPPSSRLKGKKLKQFIIEKLNYKGLRQTFYPKYFSKIGIKACVYCNSVLTVSSEHTGTKYSARFDVDHYHAKDVYPFLSVFPFNLYPSCAPCNRKKSTSTKLKFNLYSSDTEKTRESNFRFELNKGSISKYLLTKDFNDLKFTFSPIGNNFQNSFGIEEIYNTQKDIIEELIVKSQMYDKYNRKVLKNSYSKLHLHPNLYLRTLVGTYIKEHEIHKRPMSKFMQDIAKQLKLI